METKFDGIILSKHPFQDRHLLGRVLLRNGKKISVIFYGGRGGGAKQKPAHFELGQLVHLELKKSNTAKQDALYQSLETKVQWQHEYIRNHYQGFLLLCFFLEIIEKIAPEDNLVDPNWGMSMENAGLFRVLSNGIVFLDHNLKKQQFIKEFDASVFLTKLLIEQGLFPNRESCAVCGENLSGFIKMHHHGATLVLSPDEGGFTCGLCLKMKYGEQAVYGSQFSGIEVWEFMGVVSQGKYLELKPYPLNHKNLGQILFHYLMFQYGITHDILKTSKSVFSASM